MYAIVEIAGHQYKVEKDQQVFVNRLDAKEGAKIKFDRVLLTDKSGDVTVGAPAINGLAVHATVERHLKGCLLYTSPSPRDRQKSRMPSSA